MTDAQDEIRERYRALALDWAAAFETPRKANRIFKQHHAFYKSIGDSEDGQRALTALLGDPEPAVRILAATHSLRFAPVEAQQVLENLVRDDGPYAVDAKYTLISYREGTLHLDW